MENAFGITPETLSLFDRTSQAKIKVFQEMAVDAKSRSLEEYERVCNQMMTFTITKAQVLIKTDAQAVSEFIDFIKIHTLSELKCINPKWQTLKHFKSNNINELFEYLCETGRLCLLHYIQENIKFNLVEKFFLGSDKVSRRLHFKDPIITGKSWHMLFYVKESLKPCHVDKVAFTKKDIVAHMKQVLDGAKISYNENNPMKTYIDTFDPDVNPLSTT